MNCGRLSVRNDARNESGSQSIAKRAKSSAWRLGREPKPQLENSGRTSRLFIANVPFATRIFGRRMQPSCHRNVTVLVARKADKPTTSSGLTIRCANVVVDWCVKHSRSRKSWPITSVPFGISSTTITHSSTQNRTSLLLHDYPLAGRALAHSPE